MRPRDRDWSVIEGEGRAGSPPDEPSPHPDPLPSHRMGAEREQPADAIGFTEVCRATTGSGFGIQIKSKNGSRSRRNPHLTLTLSPPIGWERRGNSRRKRLISRKFAKQRQVQGSNAQVAFGGNLCQPHDGNAALSPARMPDGGQRTARPTFAGLTVTGALIRFTWRDRTRPSRLGSDRTRSCRARRRRPFHPSRRSKVETGRRRCGDICKAGR